MKNLKVKLKSLLIATLIASSFTIKANADTSDIYLSSVKNTSNNIELSIDNIKDDVRAFQIKIKLNSTVEFDSLKWDSSLNSSNINKNYKLNDDNSIDIYVTSNKSLNKDDILEIGTIVLKNPENIQNYGDVVVEGEEFKYIYSDQNKKGQISNLESVFSNNQYDDNGTDDDSNSGNNDSNTGNDDVIPPSNEEGSPDNGDSGSNGGNDAITPPSNENNNGSTSNSNKRPNKHNNNKNESENDNLINNNPDSNVNNQKLNWVKNPDNTWKLLNDGKIVSGWSLYDNKWYFTNESGIMQTGWKLVNNKWYYLNSSGDMATGWKLVNNKWYYLNSSGDMTTGWKFINNKWYYLNSNGDMAYNTVIDGYKLGSDGAWVK